MFVMFVQVSTIEFSLVEVSVVHGLKQGNEVLKEIHKEMNLESVEKLLEETAEAREYQRVRIRYHVTATDISSCLQEIGDMLANTLTLDDEEAVQKELLALEEAVRLTIERIMTRFNDILRRRKHTPKFLFHRCRNNSQCTL